MSDDYIRNDQIQAALVAYAKGKSNITDQVNSDEIREDQWQGTGFTYPNIRIRMIDNSPVAGKGCSQEINLSWMVFTEDSSSLEADQIAGIISTELHTRQFNSNNFAFSLRTTNLVPAIRIDERTWRSEVLMSGIVGG